MSAETPLTALRRASVPPVRTMNSHGCACAWACVGLHCACVAQGLRWPCSPESHAGEPETTRQVCHSAFGEGASGSVKTGGGPPPLRQMARFWGQFSAAPKSCSWAPEEEGCSTSVPRYFWCRYRVPGDWELFLSDHTTDPSADWVAIQQFCCFAAPRVHSDGGWGTPPPRTSCPRTPPRPPARTGSPQFVHKALCRGPGHRTRCLRHWVAGPCRRATPFVNETFGAFLFPEDGLRVSVAGFG